MPDTTGAAGDGGQGGEGNANDGGTTQGAGAPNSGAGNESKPLQLTQAEFDAIIRDRVARAKPADYEDLKTKAAEYDKAQAANQTELERAQARAAKAEQERDAALTAANQTLIRAAIISEASAQNAVDPETVVALLAGAESVTVADGKVAGAKEAVKALLKEKTFLVKGAPAGGGAPSGGEFGGNDPKTLQERIAGLEREGKYGEARALKMQQMAGLATS